MVNLDKEIQEHRKVYTGYWQGRSQFYWFWRLAQEVWELFWSLLSVHKDTPEWELKQISTIATNWIAYRDSARMLDERKSP